MNSRLDTALGRLEDEHHELMGLIGQAGRAVDLAPFLDKLHQLLVAHFSHEQFPGGLYDCLGAYGSAHHGELKVLIEEHCQLLSRVARLLERAKLARPADEAELREELSAVIAALHDHEHREHRLADSLLASATKDGRS